MASSALITTLARAGALERAWTLLRESGMDRRADDPAALAVTGRLRKDRALLQTGPARIAGLGDAAAAYAQAHALDPQPYLGINVATLRLLAGEVEAARDMARRVLDHLDGPEPFAETPYWREATRAEALLILGAREPALEALARARAASPGNWEDQASTVRQLSLLGHALGLPDGWIDPHRPPTALHFAGHMSVADPDGVLAAQVREWLVKARIGFAYGALAAGGDIVVAEAVLGCGGELHVVLPVAVDEFIAQSVDPFGGQWRTRFDACLAAAASVTCTAQGSVGESLSYEPLATTLAADRAIGAAALQAARLQTHAIQLLIQVDGPDVDGLGVATARDRAVWAAAGRPQHVLTWPRDGVVPPQGPESQGRADRRLLALVHAQWGGLGEMDDGAFAQALDTWLGGGLAGLSTLDPAPAAVMPLANGAVLGFASTAAAAQAIASLGATGDAGAETRVLCADYALAYVVGGRIAGPALARLQALADSVLPGAPMVTRAFAEGLAIALDAPRLEPMGSIDGDELYALRLPPGQ